jgi:ribosome biogenesis GTPase
MIVNGRVIEEQKNYFLVDTSEGIVRAGIKGTLKKVKKRICSGDLVSIQIINQEPLTGLIHSIEHRTSYIHRPALANLTQIIFIVTLKNPSLDLESLDRMLFSAEAYHIQPILVFNKVDILDSIEMEKLDSIISIYNKIGYKTLKTSVVSGLNLAELNEICKDSISAFSGLSGVGKSSLLAKLFPDKDFRIGEVSGNLGRGTHTTTNIILIPISSGNGYIADTPGISFVDIPQIPEENVITCFPELAACVGQCKFNNCIHNGEPGCFVQQKIDENEIAPSRVKQYLKIFNEMKTIRKQYRKP